MVRLVGSRKSARVRGMVRVRFRVRVRVRVRMRLGLGLGFVHGQQANNLKWKEKQDRGETKIRQGKDKRHTTT